MTLIIGVNHMALDRLLYSLSFRHPSVSKDILDILENKTVGLELMPKKEREEINKLFWEGNPHSIFSAYNPMAHSYFEDIESLIEEPVYLDSYDLQKKLVELDEKYRETGRLLNSHFDNNDEIKDATHLIESFRLETEMERLDYFERDKEMLSNIRKQSLDVAIVGLGHAYRWMKAKEPGFEFLAEDQFNGILLSDITNALAVNDLQYFDIVENWRVQVFDSNRKKPDYAGIYFPYTTNEYFEIFLDKNKNNGVCFDCYGKAKIELNINSDNVIMDKKYTYHASKKFKPKFIYEGKINEDYIDGRIREIGASFVMIKSIRDTSKDLHTLYTIPRVKNALQDFEPSHFLFFPHVQDYSNIDTPKADDSDDLPF